MKTTTRPGDPISGDRVLYRGQIAKVRRVNPGRRLDLEIGEGPYATVGRHRGVHRGPGGWSPLIAEIETEHSTKNS